MTRTASSTNITTTGAGLQSGGPPLGSAEEEMEKVRAVGDLDLECVTWSLPKPEPGDRKDRTKSAAITPSCLFEPGAYFLTSSSGSESSWWKKRCSWFTTTVSTRCVRDIKREYSWKIYGICCSQDTRAEAHFVRIKFPSKAEDKAFEGVANLLNALAAKRFLQSTKREKVHPFGIGFDCGVTKSKERLYIISNCAKQTPYLRRVGVQFEVQIDGEWQRVDGAVDRIGFATYKSAPKSAVLAASTLDAISFKDDAYLRFARVTLRFGERSERTILDVGKNFEPQLIYTKTSTVLSLNRVRVRTCEGSKVSDPIRTQARLIFTDVKESVRRNTFRRTNSFGKHCASEAEKVLAVLKKTVQMASVNSLGLEDELDDDAIFQMNIQRVSTDNDFSVRAKGELPSMFINLSSHFKNSTLFLVPCFESNGVNLILQSRNGEYVLRQYISSPIKFIGSITANSFDGPKFSTFRNIIDSTDYDGSGKISYQFETGETDATTLVEMLVSIIEKLHKYQLASAVPVEAAAGDAESPIAVPSFVRLPPIPSIPSIHMSRPATANTTRRGSNRLPTGLASIVPPVPKITTTAPDADPNPGPVPSPVPSSSGATLTPASAASPPSTSVTWVVSPVSPPPAAIVFSPPISNWSVSPTLVPSGPPTPAFKVPRKPVPSSHSRSTSSASNTTQSTTSISSASSAGYRSIPHPVPTPAPIVSRNLPTPDPSAMPGGRVYELRAATLKPVITGLELGMHGNAQTVGRV